ncbi:MAG: hypothetical protein IKZ44_03080 [Clostridia bacterium]|nr:hypothetical protein [Clostridia bacterium]
MGSIVPEGPADSELPDASSTSESEVYIEAVHSGEDEVAIVVPETPTPEPEPTETPTPEPTLTPEPNPYAGVWTIEDMPFSLELRNDGTYIVSSMDEEHTGTFTSDQTSVELHVDEDRVVKLTYYSKMDVMKADDFKLVRDDLILYSEHSSIPVTFLAENDDLVVSVRGAVVEAVAKDGKLLQQYCFTKKGLIPPEDSHDWFDVSESGESAETLRVYKYDGEYTLHTRDAEGNEYQPIDVTVVSGFRYPIRAEGLDYVRTSVRSLLANENVTIDDMNRAISKDIVAAGLYTRAGAVTSGVSLISHMAEYGLSIVYQGHGSYQAARDWGVNPEWGSKLEHPTSDANGTYYYTGMQCVASIVWAYKQAGLNLVSQVNSAIGTLGERERSRDNKINYDRAESGDIIKTGTGHYQMVVDRLDTDGNGEDDAYLTYEMCAPHLTFLILTFRSVRGRDFFSMDAFFDNTGRNTKKAEYWKDTFRIPFDELPQYLQEAQQAEETERSFDKLLLELGFER